MEIKEGLQKLLEIPSEFLLGKISDLHDSLIIIWGKVGITISHANWTLWLSLSSELSG